MTFETIYSKSEEKTGPDESKGSILTFSLVIFTGLHPSKGCFATCRLAKTKFR